MGQVVGIVHPGEMGSSIGGVLVGSGLEVVWASDGRSAATRGRAGGDGLVDAGSLDALAARCDLVISVCPPAAAPEVAEQVLAAGFAGTYVDANAIAPVTARGIAQRCAAAGASFVDGGIVGPPARRAGATRLFLSGEGAEDVAALFAGTPAEAVVVDGGPGAASAVKMAYAAWTKGTTALLYAIHALVEQAGVTAPLVAEWESSQPDLVGRAEAWAGPTGAKAWRFDGETREIAAAFEAAGLPGGFHRAAGEVYRRLARFKDSTEVPSASDLVAALLAAE